MLFTLLPIIILGLFDRDVSDHMALRCRLSQKRVFAWPGCSFYVRYPELYATSRQRTQFNPWVFAGWLVNSVFHSAVIVLVVAASHGDGIGDGTGQNQGLWYSPFWEWHSTPFSLMTSFLAHALKVHGLARLYSSTCSGHFQAGARNQVLVLSPPHRYVTRSVPHYLLV